MNYSNPRMHAIIADWPYGSNLRTTATFAIETHPKRGQRAVRTTINPKTGKPTAPKPGTYARKARIVDGDDGRTYIAQLTQYGFVYIMQSNMQYSQESIHDRDPRFAAALALFNAAEVCCRHAST